MPRMNTETSLLVQNFMITDVWFANVGNLHNETNFPMNVCNKLVVILKLEYCRTSRERFFR